MNKFLTLISTYALAMSVFSTPLTEFI